MQIEHLPEISLLFFNHLSIVAVPFYRLKTMKKFNRQFIVDV